MDGKLWVLDLKIARLHIADAVTFTFPDNYDLKGKGYENY